jgi:two-component system sensor histidine kinase BaeS
MRRRLTVAILLLVAATLLVTTVSSYVLIRRAVVTTAQRELNGEAQAISSSFIAETNITRAEFNRQKRVVTAAGDFSGIGFVALYPDGSLRGQIPSDLTIGQLDVPALQQGRQVSGHNGSLLIYTAIPTPLAKVSRYVPVLIVTRQAHDPANGLRYFGLVAVIGLAVAALVASGLARRFTQPLVSAVATTGKIASGDLDARVSVSPHELPEFAQLAHSINSMGSNLVRARDQERQFLLSVSHELRTPLTSIRGYADAVIDGATDDAVGAATVISSESRRLERLVQDLLDLARLDADRFSLELRTVDGASVVARGVEGFQHRARELGLELSLAPGSDGPLWVEADADRLGQVVANLIENAASFASAAIVVGIATVAPTSAPDGLGTGAGAPGIPVIWVVDDGPGIRTEDLPLVFDRHFSSDRVRGRRKGSGLGLAIVSELATAMGAAVRAESPVAEGRGTRMSVWLRPSTSVPESAATPGPEGAATPGPEGAATPGPESAAAARPPGTGVAPTGAGE